MSQNMNSGDAWESSRARRSANGDGPSKSSVEKSLEFGRTRPVRARGRPDRHEIPDPLPAAWRHR